ncbi:hypothetical protein EUGRSUZ_G03331 [Eucalyptus grandis]|uniref:Protein RETICULATA-RELATED 4, chloroplastic n=2 Tax=Eucalyptus grandis TaxID=71139 RepID=A0A059BIW2_EUCGR|nr:hypothetical protein EUGRSUZ_G03331 [Eucalyptus grandis]
MAFAIFSSSLSPQSPSFSLTAHNHHHPHSPSHSFMIVTRRVSSGQLVSTSPAHHSSAIPRSRRLSPILYSGDGGGPGGSGGGEKGGGGGGGGGDGSRNRIEALLALAEVSRTMDSIPKDLGAAIQAGKVPAAVVERYLELEKSAVFRWLLQFGGFRERLLADDLFLAKVAMECGVGIFTKSAAELERRRERFTKELDFVFADVVMAIIADFMLVWLPAPTVSLRPPLAINAGALSTFFYGCPDNAFQVALAGNSYSLLQRIGAIVRNGAKLFVVGTGASLIGTGLTNVLINTRKFFDKTFAVEAEDVPVLSTSVAYGVYMAVSSNLRYQVLAGVIEQRILEPLLHKQKIILSAICFAVRTGNTFLGSLMWVDYARWVGIQKIRD